MIVLWLPVIAAYTAAAVYAEPFHGGQRAAFSKVRAITTGLLASVDLDETNAELLSNLRGGAEKVAVDLDDDELDVEDFDEEESIEEEESLASSTMKKLDRQKLESVKKEVASKLAKSSKKKRSSSFTIFPYIIRASLNPFTFIVMVKSYWMSLFDLDYLKKREVSGQELRSALEEKAKRSYPGPSKGKRKMKPGQAKTLSDLPQLSS